MLPKDQIEAGRARRLWSAVDRRRFLLWWLDTTLYELIKAGAASSRGEPKRRLGHRSPKQHLRG
ncbi:hypothetical protein J7M28_06070 [bacterium]|nr:hypothetical protein [bacterium]